MRIYYSARKTEVDGLFSKYRYMKDMAIINRDAGDAETSAAYYNKAKGIEEALKILGLLKQKPDYGKME